MENFPNSAESNQNTPNAANWQEVADMANQQPDFVAMADEANKAPDLMTVADEANKAPDLTAIADELNQPVDMQALADSANQAGDSFAALEQTEIVTPAPENAASTTPMASPEPGSAAKRAFDELMAMETTPAPASESASDQTAADTTETA